MRRYVTASNPRFDPRSIFVLALVVPAWGVALAYTPSGILHRKVPLPLGLDIVSTFIPIWVFGFLWLFGASSTTMIAIRHSRGHRRLWGMAGLNFCWAFSYSAAFFQLWFSEGINPGAGVAAVIFWGSFLLAYGLTLTDPLPRMKDEPADSPYLTR